MRSSFLSLNAFLALVLALPSLLAGAGMGVTTPTFAKMYEDIGRGVPLATDILLRVPFIVWISLAVASSLASFLLARQEAWIAAVFIQVAWGAVVAYSFLALFTPLTGILG